jgi:hypothetical protein
VALQRDEAAADGGMQADRRAHLPAAPSRA